MALDLTADSPPERNDMLYELWEHEGGHTFIGRDNDEAQYRRRLEQALKDEVDVRMTWSVEAATYNEAMQALYEHKGYGRYRTLEEELGETEEGN